MKISDNGIALIKRFEGLELESYQDIAGIWTIGYGHTETARAGQAITADEAEVLLRRDLASREAALRGWAIGYGVDLTQNEFDALVSFVYNVGVDGFRGSTAAKRLAHGDRVGAADALTWWNKATVNGVLREVLGLTRRRAAERALFLTPVAETSNNPDAASFRTHETTNIAPSREVRPVLPFGLRGVVLMSHDPFCKGGKS